MGPPWISTVDGISSKWVSNHPIRVILKGPSFKGWKWTRARQCAALLSYKWDPASPNHSKHCPMLWGLYINEMKLEVLISLECWYTTFFFFYTGEFNSCTLNSHTPFLKKKKNLYPSLVSWATNWGRTAWHCFHEKKGRFFHDECSNSFMRKNWKKRKKENLWGPLTKSITKILNYRAVLTAPKRYWKRIRGKENAYRSRATVELAVWILRRLGY